MEFRIADSFTGSLGKLTAGEQKAVKTTAFDLQVNPESTGHSFHRVERALDKNFWSVRVNRDIRIIVHRSKSSLLLCYVDHHDAAYKWAVKRKLETHPKTGAAQIVEIRERVEEITWPQPEIRTQAADVPQKGYDSGKEAPAPKPLLFDKVEDELILGYGVPDEWLPDVKAADEDSILDLADHLPAEAAEALLEIAVGRIPPLPKPAAPETDPFDHPDAQRRFREMEDADALERALESPWEKWTTFLHPAQRELVEKDFNGPARVSGSAGTGKTIVALHRAVHLTKQNPDSRVLLTTFTEALANALKGNLRHLIGRNPRLAERLEIYSMDAIALRLYKLTGNKKTLLKQAELFDLVSRAADDTENLSFTKAFVFAEWLEVVDAWQIQTWEEYRDVRRLGRKTRLPEPKRELLWGLFERVHQEINERNAVSMAGVYLSLTETYGGAQLAGERIDNNQTDSEHRDDNQSANEHKDNRQTDNENKGGRQTGKRNSPFDFVIVDEAQDISIPQLRFLSALGGDKPNALFFTGDLGQRIFQQAFSWKALGVDIRGRSKTLRVNYRTSHQIRAQADRLLEPSLSDVDGNVDDRSGTVSVFNGLPPSIQTFDSVDDEISGVAKWLTDLRKEGFAPHEIAVIVRSEQELDRATAAIERAELPYRCLDSTMQLAHGSAALCTMHLAKGFEFRAVAVMACDDDIIPSQQRIADGPDIEEAYETERHLLYVACTRARDRLLVTSGEHPSEYLDDLTHG